MPEFLQEHIEIVSNDGARYRFKIPTIQDEITQGFIERSLRKEFEAASMTPEQRETQPTVGSIDGLDYATIAAIRAIATFQLLLVSADCPDNWPFTKSITGAPVVDYRKWKPNKLGEAITIWTLFYQQLIRFRAGGPATNEIVEETVASVPNS